MCRTLCWPGIVSGVLVFSSSLGGAAEPEKRTVTVSALAELRVAPDQAVFSLGITTADRESLAAAKASNDQRTRAILALAEKYRLAADQIQIVNMHMGPCRAQNCQYAPAFDGSWSDPSAKPSAKGTIDHYHVSRDIEIVLKDFSSLDRFMSDAIAARVTDIEDLLFRTSKNAEHQVEARRKAVEYAKVKASHLAELNGLKLGKAIRIEEDVEMSRHTRDTGGTGAFGMRPSADASTPRLWSPIHLVAAGPSQSETPRVREEEPAATRHPIAIGLITVDATVQITFELLDQGR